MIKINRIKIRTQVDECPDLSYLTDHLGGVEYAIQDGERLKAYNDGSWCMLGISAEAEVSYPCGQDSKRLEWLTSGGIWGVESDSGEDHLEELAREELTELEKHLSVFGIDVSNFDELATAAIPEW